MTRRDRPRATALAFARRRARRSTGSCRSRRRRRAAQTPGRSCDGMRHRYAGPAASDREHVAGADGRDAVRAVKQQSSGLVEPGKRPVPRSSGSRTRIVSAEAGGALEPIGADGGKASPRSHCVRRRCIASDSAANKVLRRQHRRRGREIGRRIGRVGWMVSAIDADADRHGERRVALALDQDAGELGRPIGGRSAILPADAGPSCGAPREVRRAVPERPRTRVAARACGATARSAAA